MFPFYGLTERLILIGILLGMICNVTTAPAPWPLLNNIERKFETILQNKSKNLRLSVHRYAAGLGKINEINHKYSFKKEKKSLMLTSSTSGTLSRKLYGICVGILDGRPDHHRPHAAFTHTS